MALPANLPATMLAWQEDTAVSAGVATRQSPNADGSPTTSGMEITNAAHYVITVSAANGQNLTGAGTLQCWRYSLALQRWVRSPDLDITITPSGFTWINVRDRSCFEYDVGVNFGRVLWAPNGVAVDGGAAVTTTIEAVKVSNLAP